MYCFGALLSWALFPPFFFTFHGLILLLVFFRFLWVGAADAEEDPTFWRCNKIFFPKMFKGVDKSQNIGGCALKRRRHSGHEF
jgi:hypothetical protein